MNKLIYKCIDPETCGLPYSAGEYTYVLKNSNFGKVFVDTECQQFSNNSYYNPFGNEFVNLKNEPKELFCSCEEYKDCFKVFVDMEDYKIIPNIGKNSYGESDIVIINICESATWNKIILLKKYAKISLISVIKEGIEAFKSGNYARIDFDFYKDAANRKFDAYSKDYNINYSDEVLDLIVEISRTFLNWKIFLDSTNQKLKLKESEIEDLIDKIN